MLAADARSSPTEYNWSWGATQERDRLAVALPASAFQQQAGGVIQLHHGPLGGSRGQYHLRQILVQLGVHWLVKPEVSSVTRRASSPTAAHDETTRKFLTDQMIALEDWTKRVKRLVA